MIFTRKVVSMFCKNKKRKGENMINVFIVISIFYWIVTAISFADMMLKRRPAEAIRWEQVVLAVFFLANAVCYSVAIVNLTKDLFGVISALWTIFVALCVLILIIEIKERDSGWWLVAGFMVFGALNIWFGIYSMNQI